MLKRRLIAALAAVLLAGVGAMLLLTYVSGADQRALAGMKSVSVLVVTAAIPQGATEELVAGSVAARPMPLKAVVPGSMTSLKQVKGLVTTAALLPGEQLLASRFVDPATLPGPGEVRIPAGLQQLSVMLDAQRVLGGNLVAGTKVGVFFTVGTRAKLTLRNVLVTRVQGGLTAEPEATATPATAAPLPGGSVMVTFALTAPEAEQLIAATREGVWLSLESAASAAGTPGVTPTAGVR